MPTRPAPRTARARAREELTREIKAAARRQLASVGAAGLSLRAVARELDMVSSALYRYFPSRDDLLTALIVDAYDAAATATEQAEARAPRDAPAARWLATCHGLRRWAVRHPHEYALIFGSPVPGYAAPTATIDPAARIPLLLVTVLRDADAAGGNEINGPDLPENVRADMAALAEQIAPELSPARLAGAVLAWSQLVGLISFELFGHLNNVVHDHPAHFEVQMRGVGQSLGLGDPARRT